MKPTDIIVEIMEINMYNTYRRRRFFYFRACFCVFLWLETVWFQKILAIKSSQNCPPPFHYFAFHDESQICPQPRAAAMMNIRTSETALTRDRGIK